MSLDRDALDQLASLGGGAFVRRLADLFLEQLPTHLTDIRDGFAGSDLERVERSAHSLKSAAGNFGATALVDSARSVEHTAASGSAAGLAELITRLEREAAEVAVEIRELKLDD